MSKFLTWFITLIATLLIISIPQTTHAAPIAKQKTALAPSPTTTPRLSPPPPPPQIIPFWPNKTKLTICTSEYTPLIYCDPNEDQSTYTGFEIEFFRHIAHELGWLPSMYEFKCMNFTPLEDDLFNGGSFGNGTCDMAVNGYSAIPFLADTKGFTFTWPCTQVGKIILVKAQRQSPSMWFFLSAISWQVWVVLVITAVVTGLVVWLLEVASESLNPDTRWMSNVMWDTIGRPVQMRDYRLSSLAGNLLALMWSFSAFIIMAMYIGNLSANLTTAQITSVIKGLTDLPGKRVATWDKFVEPLKRYNIMAKGYPWESAEDELRMIDLVKNGEADALVMESPTLYVHDATDCHTKLIQPAFDLVDIAQVFPPGFNDSNLLREYNDAVLRVLDAGIAEDLNKQFIQIQQAQCKTGDVTNETMQVEWNQVAGLWVMMAVALGVGLIILGFMWVPRWIASNKKLSRWFPCCARFASKSPYNSKFNKAYKSMVRIGTGARRTPKSFEPRIPLHYDVDGDERDREAEIWAEQYYGSSLGYLDGSADAPPHPIVQYHRENAQRHHFERTVMAQLSHLQATIARLDGGNGGGVNSGGGTSGNTTTAAMNTSTAAMNNNASMNGSMRSASAVVAPSSVRFASMNSNTRDADDGMNEV